MKLSRFPPRQAFILYGNRILNRQRTMDSLDIVKSSELNYITEVVEQLAKMNGRFVRFRRRLLIGILGVWKQFLTIRHKRLFKLKIQFECNKLI